MREPTDFKADILDFKITLVKKVIWQRCLNGATAIHWAHQVFFMYQDVSGGEGIVRNHICGRDRLYLNPYPVYLNIVKLRIRTCIAISQGCRPSNSKKSYLWKGQVIIQYC